MRALPSFHRENHFVQPRPDPGQAQQAILNQQASQVPPGWPWIPVTQHHRGHFARRVDHRFHPLLTATAIHHLYQAEGSLAHPQTQPTGPTGYPHPSLGIHAHFEQGQRIKRLLQGLGIYCQICLSPVGSLLGRQASRQAGPDHTQLAYLLAQGCVVGFGKHLKKALAGRQQQE